MDTTTDIRAIKAYLANQVAEIYAQGNDEIYRSGACGALTLALWQAASQHPAITPDMKLDITVLFRVERDNDTDEELDRVVSHAMLGLGDDTLDIDGWGADDRWNTRIEETISPWADNAYNDVDYQVFTELAPAIALIEQYSMTTTLTPSAAEVFKASQRDTTTSGNNPPTPRKGISFDIGLEA